MVATTELSYEEVLLRLQKILKNVVVVPKMDHEYSAAKPPPPVSCSLLVSIAFSLSC